MKPRHRSPAAAGPGATATQPTARQPTAADSPLVSVARSLMPSEPAIVVSAAMSDAADDATRDLIDSFVATAGPPPADFTWMALGSHARRELHLASDQDHALVWAAARAADSTYATDLAGHVIAGLEAFGMQRCSGGYMADAWSHSLDEWVDLLRARVASPTAEAVLDADIFLDLRPIAGALDAAPVVEVLRMGADSLRLLHGLALAANSFAVPLTALKRLPHRTIDVKKSGLAPLVLLARLYGLVAGSDAIATRDRLAAAAEHGTLSEQLSGRLDFAATLLTRLRLHSQLAGYSRGEAITDLVDTDALPWQDQRLLRSALRSIASGQATTAVAFRTDL